MEKSKTALSSGSTDINPTSAKGNRAVFLVAALDMSWRLAIVVLVPIVGGFELDKHLSITPAMTIVGFLVAMVGLFYILKRTMALANEKFKTRPPR